MVASGDAVPSISEVYLERLGRTPPIILETMNFRAFPFIFKIWPSLGISVPTVGALMSVLDPKMASFRLQEPLRGSRPWGLQPSHCSQSQPQRDWRQLFPLPLGHWRPTLATAHSVLPSSRPESGMIPGDSLILSASRVGLNTVLRALSQSL